MGICDGGMNKVSDTYIYLRSIWAHEHWAHESKMYTHKNIIIILINANVQWQSTKRKTFSARHSRQRRWRRRQLRGRVFAQFEMARETEPRFATILGIMPTANAEEPRLQHGCVYSRTFITWNVNGEHTAAATTVVVARRPRQNSPLFYDAAKKCENIIIIKMKSKRDFF